RRRRTPAAGRGPSPRSPPRTPGSRRRGSGSPSRPNQPPRARASAGPPAPVPTGVAGPVPAGMGRPRGPAGGARRGARRGPPEGVMPRYVSLFTYTGEAWRQMLRDPADRAEAARSAIERAGGRMGGFYWMMGGHDGLVVYSMPDEVAAAAYSAAASASGRLTRHETFQVLGMADARQALEQAREVSRSYRPPGAPADWREEYDAWEP